MNPYQDYLASLSRLVRDGKALPLGGFPMPAHAAPEATAPRALIFAPHPDDEVIIGGLPLRLKRELGWNVVNVAVTQGSNKARQSARWKELEACCNYVGFGLLPTREGGLEGINLKSRTATPAEWECSVQCIASILAAQKPAAVFFPHDDDWNATHIGTHHLIVDALKTLGSSFSTLTVETEFWGAMDTPNLMIESSESDLVDLVTALTFHVGEVQRNPYHVRMPAWLIDNVRRGGELVGGQGGAAPDFLYATLYRLRRWRVGGFHDVLSKGEFVSAAQSLRTLFAAG